ncbi:MAG: glycosyl hydrolase family 32 [Phycisphaerae bacterium]|nr:glycosyl hydrolase family 32 [Phycisphaerae bacterium]
MTTTLYNGIQLSNDWPPRDMDRDSREPMPIPYLRRRPDVVPIDIGRQLFVDNFLIERTSLVRHYHHPVKYEGNPVLWPVTDTEMGHGQSIQTVPCAVPKGGAVLFDNDKGIFRMWYEAGWLGMGCYAESEDGLVWRRPKLDVVSDACAENQFFPNEFNFDSWSVILDPHTTDESQRFKLFMRGPSYGSLPPKLHAWVSTSNDGIHWSTPIKTGPTYDRSTCFYNPFRRKWVFSLRGVHRCCRDRLYVEHDDFLEGSRWNENTPVFWTGADDLDEPGELPPQLYNLDAAAYESIIVGLFEIFKGPENHRGEATGEPKLTELMTAFSRDGFHWHRPDRRPFIPADRTAGSWEFGYVQPCSSVCLVVGDELWFYYIAFAGDHHCKVTRHDGKNRGLYANGSTGLAKLRRDGFASLDVGFEAGEVVTRPVTFQGQHLFVNANTKAGQLSAEVMDVDGKAIPGFALEDCNPFTGNSTCQPITWQNADLASLVGRPVGFRFHMTRGSLYSFWVSPDQTGKSLGYLAGGGPGYDGLIDG